MHSNSLAAYDGPRITELKDSGKIEEVRQTKENGRAVAVFMVVKQAQGGLW